MTELAIILASACGGALGSVVVWLLVPREIAVRDVEASQELTSAMRTLSDELVRTKMRTVRAAAKEASAIAQPPAAASNVTPMNQPLTKDQLRQIFRERVKR